MTKAERDKARGDQEETLEEGYYFDVVYMFCDFLEEAYYENSEDGKKWEHLMEALQTKLPAEVFQSVFVDEANVY